MKFLELVKKWDDSTIKRQYALFVPVGLQFKVIRTTQQIATLICEMIKHDISHLRYFIEMILIKLLYFARRLSFNKSIQIASYL